LNRSLVGKFQLNSYPSNTYTFNCTSTVGDWPVFLCLKRIAKKLPHFYISSLTVSVRHGNIASISHAENEHVWNSKKYGFKDWGVKWPTAPRISWRIS